jgi:hypothetical protein
MVGGVELQLGLAVLQVLDDRALLRAYFVVTAVIASAPAMEARVLDI